MQIQDCKEGMRVQCMSNYRDGWGSIVFEKDAILLIETVEKEHVWCRAIKAHSMSPRFKISPISIEPA